jgi:fructokinase
MKQGQNKILCFGEVLWDNLPTGPKPGGAPMNVAIHLKRFGFTVAMASRIGSDSKGDELLAFMEKAGLDTRAVQRDPELPTSQVLVSLDSHDNPTYEIREPVAWDRIETNETLSSAAREAGVFVYGSLASRNMPTRETLLTLLQSKALRIMDINLRPPFDQKDVVEPLMHRADMIKLNTHELKKVAHEWNGIPAEGEEEMMRWVAGNYRSALVCVTKGDEGAVLLDHDEIIRHPGFTVKVADSVGAGDAFMAGFIARHLQGDPAARALEYACATGALVASRDGATPDYTPTDIDKIIQKQS